MKKSKEKRRMMWKDENNYRLIQYVSKPFKAKKACLKSLPKLMKNLKASYGMENSQNRFSFDQLKA